MGEGFRFELEERQDCLKVRLYGSVDIADVIEVADAISENGAYIHARRLWDLSECTLGLSSSDVRSLAEIGKARDRSPSRTAIVAPRDLNYGLSRMHEVFRESDGASTRVFREEDEAFRWIMG